MKLLAKTPIAMAVATAMLLQSMAAVAASAVTLQPTGGPDVSQYLNNPNTDPVLPAAVMQKLLQQKIKYVFVIFNENHSFDNEYGTFPGVNGLYSDGQNARSAANTPGFTQTYTDVDGNAVSVQPFRIGPDLNSNVVDSVDHSHTGLAKKLDVVNGVPQMDGFAKDEYNRFVPSGATTAQVAEGKQFANLVMSHVDCDTIPFFWKWASNFTIFDNIFATEDTPSSPNAIAMIAGQAGETQWVKHPSTNASAPTANGTTGTLSGSFLQGGKLVNFNGQTGTTIGVPLTGDGQPYYGSEFDATVTAGNVVRQPYGPNESYAATNIASNLTFATVPLTLMGNSVTAKMNQDLNPSFDLPDIQNDIPYIQSLNRTPTDWRWYQNGYDLESTDTTTTASHVAYVSHHQGPQYFGYLANNPATYGNLRGETDFFTDVANNTLPQGGVMYIRGGYKNQMGLTPYTNANTPAAEAAAIVASKSGDDDHPGYSDRQLSEAMAARVINAVAGNPALWAQSAIIVTYDESDGYYDHVPPRILSYGPDSLPLSRGVRVPLILISPYARTHAVSHVEGDHNSVIETINAIFNLPALASLPEEKQALLDGNSAYFNQFAPTGFQQQYLGPRDINSPISESLLSGFDPKRLLGTSAPLPASFAQIDPTVVTTLPHYAGQGCQALNFTPVAPASDNVPPTGFNPLPSTYPAGN